MLANDQAVLGALEEVVALVPEWLSSAGSRLARLWLALFDPGALRSKIDPPIADFKVTGSERTLTFVNNSVGAKSLLWLFHDGTTSTAAVASKTYADAGEYIVRLVVTNANGEIGHRQCTVKVAEALPPPPPPPPPPAEAISKEAAQAVVQEAADAVKKAVADASKEPA